MACACLAQAETFFLLGFPLVCMPLVVTAFTLAWRQEGRWIITETTSNYLGIFIGLATGGWILLQLPRSDQDLIAVGVPWPAGLLPHLGPLLLVLLVVKLFRPKQLADFWIIQTIGLMLVTLACVLAGDALFMALLLLYLASLLWCLALFHLYRARHPAGTAPLFVPNDASTGPPIGKPAHLPSGPALRGDAAALPWRFLGAGKVARWLTAVLVIGLPLFVLMPRSGNVQWLPQKLSSGATAGVNYTVDSGINVNRVGTVELSPDPAFYVKVTDHAGGVKRLRGDPLWYVDCLDFYQGNHWRSWSQAQPFLRVTAGNAPARGAAPAVALMPLTPVEVPSTGRPIKPTLPEPASAEHLYLHFTVQPALAGGLALAEPMDTRHAGLDPWIGDKRPALDLFHAVPGGDCVFAYTPKRKETYRYTQVLVPTGPEEGMPARSLDAAYRDYLTSQTVPEAVAEWTRRLVGRLPALMPEQRLLDEQGRLAPEHHAVVSHAVSRHLAVSGEYSYSLNLRRQDPRLDPTADFLINVKQGHCERYASALALSLRSLGIPTRVIRGYRGADEDEEGKVVVRLDQAHSWVQALVQYEDQWYWLTLDPTPGQGAAANPLATWLDWLSGLDADEFWRRFVLNYNAEAQSSAAYYIWQGLWQSPTARNLLWQAPTGFACAALLFAGWRRRPRWLALVRLPARGSAPVSAPPGFYGRLLHLLARRLALRPAAGQTPLEFAAAAGAVLQRSPATAAWASLPEEAARALYRVRFGGHGLSPAVEESLRQQVAALEAALRHGKSTAAVA